MIGFLGEFPALVIMKTGLRNYVADRPIDDTTGDEHLLNPETLFWDTPAPMVSLNYTTGQPGSYFTLSATNFPANSDATLSVNGLPITTTKTDALGGVTVILDTSLLPAGDYQAMLSVNPQAVIPFILADEQPLRAKEGTSKATVIPEEVTLQHNYLPLILNTDK